EGQPSSIPVHRIAPKDIGQRLKRHVPLAQGERFFNFFGAPSQIRQDKRRAQREDFFGLLQPDAPQRQAFLLARLVPIVKAEARGERLRKQFRMSRVRLEQMRAIFGQVSDASLVMRFTLKEQTDMLLAAGWRVGFRLYWIRHPTVWNIRTLPSHYSGRQRLTTKYVSTRNFQRHPATFQS